MSANDDLDPLLDAWLQRGVQPLAPPPGAFEKVSRRARRRKMGRLVVTASSAAAVAAAAVFAVPAISSLRLSPSGSSGNVAAGRSTTPAPATTAPRPTASPASTSRATVAPTSTGAVAQNSGTSASSLPPSFQPASVTFVSATVGWVLGHSISGGSTCGSGTCVSVVTTTDGGHTWAKSSAPSVNAFGTGTGGVSNLRYLDGTNGWAYGPDLWSTHDGGQTWSQVPTGGQVVVDVEASHGEAFAVFATCGAPAASAAAAAVTEYGRTCTSFTLESAAAGTDSWAPVGPATTSLSYASATPVQLTSPSIVFGGSTGWLLGPRGEVYSGSLAGGAWSQVSATPCPPPVTSQAMTPSQLYWDNSGTLLYGCGIPESDNGKDYPDFFVSTDGGQTWHLQANGPTPDAFSALTYSPTAPIIIASPGGLYIRRASTQLWTHIPGTPAGGFSWVGSTEPTQGVAIPAEQLDKIWMTYDGGLTWQPSTIGS